jgi:hypothetical protein
MALYKYKNDVTTSTDDAFDRIYRPGDTTPYSGVYRCQSCAVEIVSEQAKPFPPTRACADHNRKVTSGTITWRMAVYAQHAN